MRLWITKIDQQPISEILRNVAAIALDHLRASGLIRTDDLPQVFGIKLAREHGGVREVAEHDGELAALGVRGVWCTRGRNRRHRASFLCGRLWRWLRCW